MNQSCFPSQNRPQPVFSVKTPSKNQFFSVKINHNHFFRPKWTKTSLSDQNRSKPGLLVTNQFFRPKSTRTRFFQSKARFLVTIIPFFRLKSTYMTFVWSKPIFYGQNRPTPLFFGQNRTNPVFLAKIDQNQFFFSSQDPAFFSQNPNFPVKMDHNHFSRSTITIFSGPIRPKPAPSVKNRVLSAQIDQNPLFPPKLTTTSSFGQNPVFSVTNQFFSAKINQNPPSLPAQGAPERRKVGVRSGWGPGQPATVGS